MVLLSGGIDSAVVLANEIAHGRTPRACVAFDYGQRHHRELGAAVEVARYYAVPLTVLRLPARLLAGSALTGAGEVPVGLHYADPGQSATVVPNRNLVFLALAAAEAVRAGASEVLFGAHAGDAAVYPDCRPEFVAAADKVFRLACGVAVRAPLLAMDKRGVVALGRRLGVPFPLTWSCYLGADEPCSKCGACVERYEAGA